MPLSASALADLREFACLGVSLMLVTRDERLMPEITRVAGARLGDDGLLRLALPLPESRRAVWNLETTPVVALSLVLPTTYRTLQVKGNDAHRVDWPDHETIARQHADNFIEEVVAVGIPRELADSFFSHRRYVTIAFTPLEMFDQTPGPASGLRVES